MTKPELDVRVKGIFPRMPLADALRYHRCFYGVSLQHVADGLSLVQPTLRWLHEQFEEPAVVIGDIIYPYNFSIFEGLSLESALVRGSETAQNLRAEIDHCISTNSLNRFIVLNGSDIKAHPSFELSRTRLNALFAADLDFYNALTRTATAFLARRNRQGDALAIDYASAVRLSCEFLLEEFATYATLVEMGYHVEVYPGSELPILKDVIRGRFPAAPLTLRNRINIELQIIPSKL